ncbi:MAG: hypothetical protein KBE23_07220 [Chloroflexi bacterium]|nr:hypothetical protein [Chloroflexota bacterium]MBP7042518.1 hypothetical protein [Chloroflexota bacterium]
MSNKITVCKYALSAQKPDNMIIAAAKTIEMITIDKVAFLGDIYFFPFYMNQQTVYLPVSAVILQLLACSLF